MKIGDHIHIADARDHYVLVQVDESVIAAINMYNWNRWGRGILVESIFDITELEMSKILRGREYTICGN
jgi:hypothetical protein